MTPLACDCGETMLHATGIGWYCPLGLKCPTPASGLDAVVDRVRSDYRQALDRLAVSEKKDAVIDAARARRWHACHDECGEECPELRLDAALRALDGGDQ